MEVSSTTSKSQSSGLSSPRLKPPPLGSTASSRWIVFCFEASRLGHSFRSTAGRSAQQNVGALRREDAQNGIDDGRFANAGATGHDQHCRGACGAKAALSIHPAL